MEKKELTQVVLCDLERGTSFVLEFEGTFEEAGARLKQSIIDSLRPVSQWGQPLPKRRG